MIDCLPGDIRIGEILMIFNSTGGKVFVAANKRKEMLNGKK